MLTIEVSAGLPEVRTPRGERTRGAAAARGAVLGRGRPGTAAGAGARRDARRVHRRRLDPAAGPRAPARRPPPAGRAGRHRRGGPLPRPPPADAFRREPLAVLRGAQPGDPAAA